MASAFLSSRLHSATTPKLQGLKVHSAPTTALLSPQSVQWLFRVDSWNRTNLHASGKRKPIPWKASRHSLHVRMGIKLVETYDGSFQLEPQSEQILKNLLSSQVFCNQVAQQTGVDGDSSFEFTGELFQPVPWSVNTKHGMPQKFTVYKNINYWGKIAKEIGPFEENEFEKYLDRNEYAIINVPPNFMFKAKIFSPSRLCAVYKNVLN